MDNKTYIGWIEIICGSMYSGKTEELIKRAIRAKIAKNNVKIFKPSIDTRYSEDYVVSHNNKSFKCYKIKSPKEMLKYIENTDVFCIDEAQFFNKEIVDICNQLANNNKRVIISGLNKDFNSTPFGSVPDLLAHADEITKLNAICVICGNIATFSYRFIKDQEQILVGEREKYEARCRNCFNNKG